MNPGQTYPADVVIKAQRIIAISKKEFDGPAALCIRKGRVQAVVPVEQADRWIGPATTVLDQGHRVLMPGFVDPHAHTEVVARASHQMVDVRSPDCPDIASVLEKLRQNLDRVREGWLVAQGNLFFDQKLKEQRLPTREELDSVSMEIAIAVRAGGHLSILNTRALELAGIDAAYQPADHSITGKPSVERDADGEPTGVVTEMDLLLPFPELPPKEFPGALERGILENFTAHGVTTIGEISNSLEGLKAYDAALSEGRIHGRFHVYLWTPGTVSLDQACSGEGFPKFISPPDYFRIQGVKAFADGGYSAKRAALSQPYVAEPHNHGEMALSTAQVVELAERTQSVGLQLAIHANGDRAQLEVCRALESVPRAAEAPRIRIEHAGNFVPDYEELTGAWKRAQVVPVPQPVFIYNFGEFVPTYVGGYAWERQFPFRRLLDDGWPLSGSSDVWVGCEVRQPNPFLGILSAVRRRTFHGKTLGAEQAVSVYEALKMHTWGGAYALGEDENRGSLESGKLADVIALDRDPLEVPLEELMDIQVEEVFLGGESVYRSQPFRCL